MSKYQDNSYALNLVTLVTKYFKIYVLLVCNNKHKHYFYENYINIKFSLFSNMDYASEIGLRLLQLFNSDLETSSVAIILTSW